MRACPTACSLSAASLKRAPACAPACLSAFSPVSLYLLARSLAPVLKVLLITSENSTVGIPLPPSKKVIVNCLSRDAFHTWNKNIFHITAPFLAQFHDTESTISSLCYRNSTAIQTFTFLFLQTKFTEAPPVSSIPIFRSLSESYQAPPLFDTPETLQSIWMISPLCCPNERSWSPHVPITQSLSMTSDSANFETVLVI